MILNVDYDENGDALIPIPNEMLESLGWNEYTVLSLLVSKERNDIVLKQKTDWTVDQLQEDDNFELAMNDVTHNGTVHFILDGGKKFVLAPYNDEMKELRKFKEDINNIDFDDEDLEDDGFDE